MLQTGATYYRQRLALTGAQQKVRLLLRCGEVFMSFRSILSTLIPFVLTLLPVRVLAQAPENVRTGTAAIERIQNCSFGGNTCSTTYPHSYCSADGETHFQDVAIPLTLVPTTSDPLFAGPMNPEKHSRWVVFPKGWGVDGFRQGVFHPNTGYRPGA